MLTCFIKYFKSILSSSPSASSLTSCACCPHHSTVSCITSRPIAVCESTPTPAATWTPTPTPKPAATWTPTPTPTPLPPGDLGYELVRYTINIDITEVGQIINFGIPEDKSPIVDSNRNDDLLDEIIVITDSQNYTIIQVTHNRNRNSEITLIAMTPTGNTDITIDFYTTKK